jgi:hypothetical protein
MMISVSVTYSVKPEFVELNKQNIAVFLSDFKELRSTIFFYNVYVKQDGLTFVHFSMYECAEIQNTILSVPSFIEFQRNRDESGLLAEPVIEVLDHLGSSLAKLV